MGLLEMPLINCKVQLKLKWTKHCALGAAGNDSINDDRVNITFTIEDTKLYATFVTFQQKTIKNYKTS